MTFNSQQQSLTKEKEKEVKKVTAINLREQ